MPDHAIRMRGLALLLLLGACAARDLPPPAPSAGTGPAIRAPLDSDEEEEDVMLALLTPPGARRG